MVFPGHIGGGYIVARGVLHFLHPDISSFQINELLVLGALAGDFPDIDVAIFYIQRFVGPKKNRAHSHAQEKEGHRDYVTHTPLFWLCVAGGVMLIGLIAGSTFIEMGGLMILGGAWTHLLLDSIEYGVKWLWPLSQKRFAIREKGIDLSPIDAPKGSIRAIIQFLLRCYWKSLTIWAELAVTLIALYMFLHAMR